MHQNEYKFRLNLDNTLLIVTVISLSILLIDWIFMPEIQVECLSCGNKNVDWAWRINNKGECLPCLYARYGETYNKKSTIEKETLCTESQ